MLLWSPEWQRMLMWNISERCVPRIIFNSLSKPMGQTWTNGNKRLKHIKQYHNLSSKNYSNLQSKVPWKWTYAAPSFPSMGHIADAVSFRTTFSSTSWNFRFFHGFSHSFHGFSWISWILLHVFPLTCSQNAQRGEDLELPALCTSCATSLRIHPSWSIWRFFWCLWHPRRFRMDFTGGWHRTSSNPWTSRKVVEIWWMLLGWMSQIVAFQTILRSQSLKWSFSLDCWTRRTPGWTTFDCLRQLFRRGCDNMWSHAAS